MSGKPQVAAAEPVAPESSIDMQTPPRAVAQGAQKVIVVLVEFRDKRHTRATENIRKLVFTDLNDYYRDVSYGLMSITGDITDKWYVTQTAHGKLDIEQWNYDDDDMEKFEREAVRASDVDVIFRNYDFVIFVSAGAVWPHANCDFDVATNDGGRLRGFVVNGR